MHRLAPLLLLIACSKSDKPDADVKKWLKLPTLGIELEVPGDATAQENQSQIGRSATIYALESSAALYITQGAPKFPGATAKSMTEAKARLDDTSFVEQKPVAYTKAEETPAGWHLEWTLSGKTSTHGYEVVTTIDGRRMQCLDLGASEAQKVKMLPACLSMRAITAK
jgi:hypothetical protein